RASSLADSTTHTTFLSDSRTRTTVLSDNITSLPCAGVGRPYLGFALVVRFPLITHTATPSVHLYFCLFCLGQMCLGKPELSSCRGGPPPLFILSLRLV